MKSTLLGLGLTVALPTLLAAQTPAIPNEHASDQGQAMVALHSQGAQHRATHRRGHVVMTPVDHTSDPNAATPAVHDTRPAVPGHGVVPTVPARRTTPAVPAHKGGQSGDHRP